MYVTTFYSFKGGVGRTMSLVNAAVTLAKIGRRVLVVDFDLEAPGLDTFDVSKPVTEVAGIVDFVAQYLESGQAPDVNDFVAECSPIGEHGGSLCIMPSGRNESYATSFNQIDWIELYKRHDGFLLFEDLKAQWKKAVNPDYVLIDSRTGHTDTSGICTRQLPDAVVILFFPNEQNLRGLIDVVGDIRKEEIGPRGKNIELHFVMSNVPDLDDEDQILESKIGEFQEQLGFQQRPLIVHRYDSLSLLNQVVFSKDRPKSRLANEHEKIVREISVRNWNDRDGALEYIRRADKQWNRVGHASILRKQEMLDKIENGYPNDGEVLFRLGELKESHRDLEHALSLIDQAIIAGYHEPEAYLKRSRIREQLGVVSGIDEDILHVLKCQNISPTMVREAISRLMRLTETREIKILEYPAVSSLTPEEKLWLSDTFDRSRDDIQLGVDLLEQILYVKGLSETQHKDARRQLGLLYMGHGRCSDAAGMFRDERQELTDMDIESMFNYAMAQWGIYGTVEIELFKQVVKLEQMDTQRKTNPNCLQCMAIAFWAVGDSHSALDYVKRTQHALKSIRVRTEFSCWRYLKVNLKEFSKDLNEIEALIRGSRFTVPKFSSLEGNPLSDT